MFWDDKEVSGWHKWQKRCTGPCSACCMTGLHHCVCIACTGVCHLRTRSLHQPCHWRETSCPLHYVKTWEMTQNLKHTFVPHSTVTHWLWLKSACSWLNTPLDVEKRLHLPGNALMSMTACWPVKLLMMTSMPNRDTPSACRKDLDNSLMTSSLGGWDTPSTFSL